MSKKLMMNNGVVGVPIYLVNGITFNSIINQLKQRTTTTITSIIFTKEKIPDNKIVEGIDVSENISEYKAYGYVDGNSIYISPEVKGGILYANKNCLNMFRSQSSLVLINFENFDTSKVANINSMFFGCSSLTSLDLSNWDVSNVTSMREAFFYCLSLTSLNILNWNTVSVTDVTSMFCDCKSLCLLNTITLNTQNCISIKDMFNGCSSLTSLDLSNWITSNISDMGGLFNGCSSLTSLDLSNWDVSNVTSMTNMFQKCYNLSGEIIINNHSISSYTNMFNATSTSSNSKFIVKYIDEETKAMAEKLVATKSSNSNVFLWEGEDI